MDLPIYCIVDKRLVKVVQDHDGTANVLQHDPVSGQFQRRMDLLERVVMQDEWVIELTEDEFVQQLEALSNARGKALKAG